jgi:hypothetical protein
MAIGTTQKVRLQARIGLEAAINTAITKTGSATTGYSAALEGEFFYTTDTKKLWMFDGNNNVRVHGLDLALVFEGDVVTNANEIVWL